MLRIPWTAKKTNERVLNEANKKRSLVRTIRKRQATFLGHVMRRGKLEHLVTTGNVGGTVASESALRSAENLLLRVRAPPPAPWPDGRPESLRSRCCGLAIYKNHRLFRRISDNILIYYLFLPVKNRNTPSTIGVFRYFVAMEPLHFFLGLGVTMKDFEMGPNIGQDLTINCESF
ncbi:eukaryotic translation initiation factor 3 subunit f [Plakobranchus ocellatus]|uniref:Eukaryotic translation initiation factor 3 subunit f n=1 Tax=Plakobranchus ocellatus TaxID=259542 RepID=A0AAV3ZAZ1_9GAST|nr:eukaryotic translation initiation factor 3 subunit f [Plakobranchus ocellatus]